MRAQNLLLNLLSIALASFIISASMAKVMDVSENTLATWRRTWAPDWPGARAGPPFIKSNEGQKAKVLYLVDGYYQWKEQRIAAALIDQN